MLYFDSEQSEQERQIEGALGGGRARDFRGF